MEIGNVTQIHHNQHRRRRLSASVRTAGELCSLQPDCSAQAIRTEREAENARQVNGSRVRKRDGLCGTAQRRFQKQQQHRKTKTPHSRDPDEMYNGYHNLTINCRLLLVFRMLYFCTFCVLICAIRKCRETLDNRKYTKHRRYGRNRRNSRLERVAC